jgi:ribosomal protein S1
MIWRLNCKWKKRKRKQEKKWKKKKKVKPLLLAPDGEKERKSEMGVLMAHE